MRKAPWKNGNVAIASTTAVCGAIAVAVPPAAPVCAIAAGGVAAVVWGARLWKRIRGGDVAGAFEAGTEAVEAGKGVVEAFNKSRGKK